MTQQETVLAGLPRWSLRTRSRTGLLVSVRNAEEAVEALAGGANVIDVKEPARGPLGPADDETIAEIVRVVDGSVPVTAAAGELVDYIARPFRSDANREIFNVALVKFGLAGCGLCPSWQREWRRALANLPKQTQAAAVVYADWQTAAAPTPSEVLAAAIEQQCPAVLVDTWNKSDGSLIDLWSPNALAKFVSRVHAAGMIVALAGSLSLADICVVAAAGPDLIAVRRAACDGGRGGRVSRQRVAQLRAECASVSSFPVPHS